MTTTDRAAMMNVSSPPITQRMTINTHGANEIIPRTPTLRNKGKVNHTVGINSAYGNSSSIVPGCVKRSTNSSSTDARTAATGTCTGLVALPVHPHPIMIKKETTNAMKDVKDTSSHNDNGVQSMPQCNRSQAATPPMTAASVEDGEQTKDALIVSPQFCEQNGSSDVIKNQVLIKNTPPRTSSSKPPRPSYRIPEGKVNQIYDMNMVPKVKGNPEFLQKFRANNASLPLFSSLPNLVPCDTSVCDASADTKSTSSEIHTCASASDQDQVHNADADADADAASSAKPCHHHHPQSCDALSKERKNDRNTAYIPTQVSPFAEDCESIVWVPTSRKDWEDCIDELVNICTAAAWHRERLSNKKKSKEFSPPISHIYVKDRIEIDDPLRGYQIRHKTGGWLQGFVMMTTFTIWTHYFKWDSLHSMNGINRDKETGVVDDGTLTKELESQERSGDPHGTGVVWPSIAEISLVGALGCGEYLVQMAIDDIERRGTYEFVVLEATQTSRPFYEKLGFVRVGAVCKYGKKEDFTDGANVVEETGYRHWTYANETTARLGEHGGPSCMMARKTKRRDNMGRTHCQSCGKVNETPSFIDKLANYFVSKKPWIEPLGTSGSRKRSRTASAGTLALASGEKAPKIAKDVTRKTSSGRQTRTPTRLEETVESQKKNPSSARSSRNSASASLPPTVKQVPTTSKPSSKPILKKQRIPNGYRDPKKIYYYNKVVTPTVGNPDGYSYKSKFYFVLHYDEDKKTIRLIPLYRKGTFKGKREGRDKWKATILPRGDADDGTWHESMDVISAPTSCWEIIPSYMVTKCSSVGEESWDINPEP